MNINWKIHFTAAAMARPIRPPSQRPPEARCCKGPAALSAALPAARLASLRPRRGPERFSRQAAPGRVSSAGSCLALVRIRSHADGGHGPRAYSYCRRWHLHVHAAIHRSFLTAVPHAPPCAYGDVDVTRSVKILTSYQTAEAQFPFLKPGHMDVPRAICTAFVFP